MRTQEKGGHVQVQDRGPRETTLQHLDLGLPPGPGLVWFKRLACRLSYSGPRAQTFPGALRNCERGRPGQTLPSLAPWLQRPTWGHQSHLMQLHST